MVLIAGRNEGAELGQLTSSNQLDVRVLGRVPDVPVLLHAADVLVLPTLREGFPNVVLEAAASGLPVVTTDATGAVDSVVSGVTGYIVGRRDAVGLSAALSRLIRDEPRRALLGRAARRRVEAEFESSRVWEGMLRHYCGDSTASVR